MNILSTNGLVGRYVTDWTGPGAVLDRRQHPARGAQLPRRHHDPDRHGHRQGRRRRRRRDGVRSRSTLRGANSLGDHVTGTVRLLLPAGRCPMSGTEHSLRRHDGHRRHRRHRILQGVGPQRAAPGRGGGRSRPARRRDRAGRGRRPGHLQLGHQPRDRHRPQPRHGGALLLQPHPLRRRGRVRHHPAGGAWPSSPAWPTSSSATGRSTSARATGSAPASRAARRPPTPRPPTSPGTRPRASSPRPSGWPWPPSATCT